MQIHGAKQQNATTNTTTMAQDLRKLLRGTEFSNDAADDFLNQMKDDDPGDNSDEAQSDMAMKQDSTSVSQKQPVPKRRSESSRYEFPKGDGVVRGGESFLKENIHKTPNGKTIKHNEARVVVEQPDGTTIEYSRTDNAGAQPEAEKLKMNTLAEKMKGQ